MDGENQSSRPEQAPLERFPPEVAEINSKYHMDGSTTMENRQISGVCVTFGPGMEVHKVMPEMTLLPYYKAECKRVNVYWGRQFSKYAIQMDQDPSSLLTIHTLFLSGEIQVRGKQVATQYFSSGPGSGRLELLELPPSVTWEDIKSQIPQKLLRGAQWSTKQPKCKDGSALSTVLSLITQFGPLKDQKVETLPTMMRVSALFQNENDARRAVEVLNQSPLPLDSQQKLIARLEYQTEFKGPKEWVQHIPGQLLNKASISRNIHQIKLALSLDGEPRFSLSGENSEVLVEAMKRIRELPVSGQIHEEKSGSRDFTTTDECCVICDDTAESPVITRCKHVYCGNCFHSLCSSTFSIGSWRDRAVCQAPKPSSTSTALDNSICGCTLTLPELQALLEPSTFERLLIASFKSYVHRHPDKLQNCPTTNCDYIYFTERYDQPDRHSDNPATAPHITCPHCLTNICTRCQEGHAARGMTCAEFQDHLAQGAHSIALAKAEQGIKDCPKCTTSLVKVNGCNHVTCPVCNTHLCWKCLEMFRGEDAADRVYRHLVDVHDAIYDDLPDEEDEEDLDDDDDDDDDDDREQDYRFGGPEVFPLARLVGLMERIMGNAVDPDWAEEGQGEQADTGQEDNGDDDEGAGVNGEDAANQGIEIEDEQVGLRVQGAPEAQYQEVRLERVAGHEVRLERMVWQENGRMNERAQPHQRRDWEEIDVIVHDISYNFGFFVWLFFFIISFLWKSLLYVVLFTLCVYMAVILEIISLAAMIVGLFPFLFRMIFAVFVVFPLVFLFRVIFAVFVVYPLVFFGAIPGAGEQDDYIQRAGWIR